MASTIGVLFAMFVVKIVNADLDPRSGFSQSFPIGSMFDQDQRTLDIQAGFQVAITRNNRPPKNRNERRVRIQSHSLRLDMNDPYSVSSACCSLLSSGIFAMFGSHTMNTLNAIHSYSSTFKMPYISLSMPVDEEPYSPYHLYTTPHYIDALLVIIQMYRWPKVYYMYNTRAGLENYQQLLIMIRKEELDIRLIMVRVENGANALDVLDRMDARDNEDKRIIVDLPTPDCKHLLTEKARLTKTVQHHYFLASLGLQEFEIPGVYANGGMNITGFKMVDFKDKEVGNFLRFWQAEDERAWTGLDKDKIPDETAMAVDAVQALSIALTELRNSDRGLFARTLRDSKVYNNGSEGIDCQDDNVSPWQHGDAIIKALRKVRFQGLTGNVEFDDRGFRKNYKLSLLEVTTQMGLAEGHPYLIRRTGTYEGNDQFEGYCADLAEKIAEELPNFQYQIVPVADGTYGSLNENGTWNGMVGELIRHEADLAIAPLTITSGREKVIDFSKPFMSLGISIMIKKNEKKSPGVFSFMYPLSYEIWMCVIFAYIGVSVVLFLVSRFSPYEWHIEDNTDGPTVTNNFTIFNSLWFSLGAFMQQGCDIEPRSMSGRIVGSVWWFFTLIVISSYTANLAAFLTVSRMQSPIESADDLAKQTEIKYGTVKGGSTEGFFKESEIAVYERMWAFMSSDPSNSVSTNEEGVDRVRRSKGRYAFLMESTTNDYINQRKPCDTMKVGNNLDSKGYGIATPISSPLRDQINLAVLGLREKGELTKLETKWWYDKGECGNKRSTSVKDQDTTNSLKLSNVAGIFYILIAGLVLALVMAFVEFMYKSRTEAHRRKASFSNAVRSKAKLSITGKPEQQISADAYAPAAQLISLDGYAEANTHTEEQVWGGERSSTINASLYVNPELNYNRVY
uniref:Glutamate receptor n=1 Tax=Capitella teleta TaxID=283909 RepID=X2AX36_CAPTE